MGKIKGLLDILINLFTRQNERHNRALSDIMDLSGAIEEFMAKYGLQESGSDSGVIFENIGQAKFDVTTITYQSRIRIKIAKDLRDKDFPPLLKEVHNDLEEVKRGIFNPKVGSVTLDESVFKLHKSFDKLRDAISGIEYK